MKNAQVVITLFFHFSPLFCLKKDLPELFKKDADIFAMAGLKLSETVYGKGSRQWKFWEEGWENILQELMDTSSKEIMRNLLKCL